MKSALVSILPVVVYLFFRRLSFRVFRNRQFNELQNMRRITSSNYSYKPFDDKKAIFIHIPKCAGISVNTAIFGNYSGGHKKFDDYILIFGAKELLSYFKFTFVRNPWDRLVSAYFFLKDGGMNEWDRRFFEDELARYKDFDEFVRCWLTKENIYKFHHFKPQLFYLKDKYNKVSVDYIGYFENIDLDFEHVAREIGIEINLKKQNSANRRDYRTYYSQETKNIVADVYEEDIQAFNYDFNGVKFYKRVL